ncbi:uncharacterized protein F5Z01DRAFT_719919 [Emericellopsis atlantica]|uniref:Uncharacterized protein n=1 Tax=Emericellopsis atlantica TaxID=2614577 RepID=A0A9P7ZRZ3_9HYPO|nr:uncharacterized protein F5Z01DRAFT_719919 [Emericellopsis atlantica]KAG9256762.1 hypothetical protein F5Z01DRAFT_719919 [Emericellopsis atlantica]
MAPVWFITATSSGFGHEIALCALRRGHTVIATARNISRIQDLAEAGAHTMAFDVTSPLPELQETAKNVFDKFGRVDYLVNAAGFILEGALEEFSPEEIHRIFNVNVFGMMTTFKAFLPHVRTQEIGEGGARATVVCIGSLASWQGGASYAAYSMTKAACSMLMESLRIELAPYKITSTVIEPGYFRTGFLSSNALVQTKERIDAYEDPETPTGVTREGLRQVHGNQPGDVRKGAEVVVQVLTRTGVSKGREVPVRIVLGTDCEATIRAQCAKVTSYLEEWQDVIRSTDYPKGE